MIIVNFFSARYYSKQENRKKEGGVAGDTSTFGVKCGFSGP